MASFDAVADEYDAGRPGYPAAVFDALGGIDGRRVLDIGAGTGIATRDLMARGASVVAIDPGREVLRRASARTPDLCATVADGTRLPVRSRSVDLVCFAQSWHWLEPATRDAEVRRVLRQGGRWAGWWSHARADGEPWFDSYWSAIERACPGTVRTQRDTDWGATVDRETFHVGKKIVVPWSRTTSADGWMLDQASHSYVVALSEDARRALLDELRAIVVERFLTGAVVVPYETWLWVAVRA